MLAEPQSLPEPYGPANYATVWPIFGVVVLLVVIAWWAWLLWPARRNHEPAPSQPVSLNTSDCLAALDRIAAQHRSGALSDRAAVQHVSALVREYVDATRGSDLRRRSLSALPADEVGVRDLVARSYPGAFGFESADPDGIIAEARRVVST